MESKKEIISFLRKNKNYFQEDFHITKIALFGSFAREEQGEESDVDILIELKKNTPNIFELKTKLREYLKNKFNREVDIAREKYLKPCNKEEILKEAIYV